MNFVKDLFTKEEMELYNKTEYPFNLSILHTALLAKLEKDPDYEMFVPLVYYKAVTFIRNTKLPTRLTPYGYFVSNKGNVLSLRNKEPLVISTCVSKNGYVRFSVAEPERKQIKLLLHRAIACSLIPVGSELGGAHPKDLEVNHLDGIKTNYKMSNLEWCFDVDNKKHALLTGLMMDGLDHYSIKPVKGIVKAGRFKDLIFILVGSKNITSSGFDKAAVSKCCLGLVKTHNACNFSFATEDEIKHLPHGISQEVMQSITEINLQIKSDILASNISTGEVITIKGGKQELVKLGFDESAVSKVMSGKLKTHKGFIFRRLETAA